jgi:hypothetical protein
MNEAEHQINFHLINEKGRILRVIEATQPGAPFSITVLLPFRIETLLISTSLEQFKTNLRFLGLRVSQTAVQKGQERIPALLVQR